VSVEIRNAATVVLTRDREDGPPEIFFMQRGRTQSFMGGAFVFPGGRLEEADCDAELHDRIHNAHPRRFQALLQEDGLPEAVACGFYCAAIRETFEESGILLAVGADGQPLDWGDEKTQSLFRNYRARLNAGDATFNEMAVREDIRLAVDHLVPYARWITPDIESKRFDTRFFLARLPQGQTPVHDAQELTASCWMTASLALAQNAAGNITLMPPTLKTAYELSAFRTTKELFEYAAGRSLRPMLPQFFETADGGRGLKLPYDPEYGIEGYRLPPRPGEPSRLRHFRGIWMLEEDVP
jgi:8-oxo-dGTP pyrophosphatase MutT (NUDIX family)